MTHTELSKTLRKLREDIKKSEAYENASDEYGEALDLAIAKVETRAILVKEQAEEHKSKIERIESAIGFVELLLGYHRRVSMVTDPNFVSLEYEEAMLTALESLQQEKKRLCTY